MYVKIKNIMKECCFKMDDIIIAYASEAKEVNKLYFYDLFLENFKNIEVICNNIDIKAYSQACSTLRNAIEQVCILKVLYDNRNVLDSYKKFADLKLGLINDKEKYENELEDLFKKRKIKNVSKRNYLDFGWLETLNVEKISIEEILKIANFEDLILWRRYLNEFVHKTISVMSFKDNGLIVLINKIIHITATLFDCLVCMFHNFTGFSFILDGIDYHEKCSFALKSINEYEKKHI